MWRTTAAALSPRSTCRTFLTVGSALAVGSNPYSIAIDPTGTYAYVANYGGSTVTKINLSDVPHSRLCVDRRVKPVQHRHRPHRHVRLCGELRRQLCHQDQPVDVPTVGSALAVGSNPYSIAIDPTGTYAYVANDGGSTVTKINLSTFLTVGSALAVGSNPYSIAIDPAGAYAYVANEGGSTVTKINL